MRLARRIMCNFFGVFLDILLRRFEYERRDQAEWSRELSRFNQPAIKRYFFQVFLHEKRLQSRALCDANFPSKPHSAKKHKMASMGKEKSARA